MLYGRRVQPQNKPDSDVWPRTYLPHLHLLLMLEIVPSSNGSEPKQTVIICMFCRKSWLKNRRVELVDPSVLSIQIDMHSFYWINLAHNTDVQLRYMDNVGCNMNQKEAFEQFILRTGKKWRLRSVSRRSTNKRSARLWACWTATRTSAWTPLRTRIARLVFAWSDAFFLYFHWPNTKFTISGNLFLNVYMTPNFA